MAEEYDPEAFAIRVSQRLFHVLSGRAVEPGPIEPRNQREALLVESVRKEGRREKLQMLQSLKEENMKQAQEREETAHMTLEEVANKLDDQFSKLNIPILNDDQQSETTKPCDSLRTAVLTCYKQQNVAKNPLACTTQVEAFTECAKMLCNVTSN